MPDRHVESGDLVVVREADERLPPEPFTAIEIHVAVLLGADEEE